MNAKRRILLVRSVPLSRDSRSTKMIDSYRKEGCDVIAAVWTRGETPSVDPSVRNCTAPGGYGRKLSGLIQRVRWFWFLFNLLVSEVRDYDVVHPVDLDTAILVVPLARVLGKRVVYDAFDQAASIFKPGLLHGLLAVLERRLIGWSDLVIFPDPVRLMQYGLPYDDNRTFIIGNIPDMGAIEQVAFPPLEVGPLRIVYVGTLEAHHRGLEYIPEACARFGGELHFLVAGLGQLSDFFSEQAKSWPNLTFLGQLDYADALKLMTTADCLYGPYLLTTRAHQFAAPNKAYEHLALGKPLITSVGTPPADLVYEVGSGFIFDGSRDGLFELICHLDRSKCRAAGERALQAWSRRYSTLRDGQLRKFFQRFEQIR